MESKLKSTFSRKLGTKSLKVLSPQHLYRIPMLILPPLIIKIEFINLPRLSREKPLAKLDNPPPNITKKTLDLRVTEHKYFM